eukprot:CAMPEP_0176125784 /NCGR_PEP_ID=MMETSP0120_2-20121206/63470_1 /TAXON_ID=160619 /ORGANISM="Kryptoperidinium foliaceum, Strain CCMP 1326" /LENGTH=34 /DNA_ID= /DNA_START= /DNA_END= /DNA_ORIENTATION=
MPASAEATGERLLARVDFFVGFARPVELAIDLRA